FPSHKLRSSQNAPRGSQSSAGLEHTPSSWTLKCIPYAQLNGASRNPQKRLLPSTGGILESIQMLDMTSRDKTSSHHAHARA
ncbi:hypothetical protein A2U01_0086319, partial [Trifolium medium]|nr:hypothetical protein [Trifolium medium]